MSSSGEAAEQVMRITMDGVQMLIKLSGDSAERLQRMITLALKDSKTTSKGKASLKKMLKSNSPVRVFELNDRDLKKFCEAAKKYGVMYHVLKDKNSKSEKCDIMVREEDAAKVNRIFERFSLGANNKALVRNALADAKKSQKEVPMRTQPGKTPDDKFVEMLFNNPPQKEKSFIDNPSVAKTEKSRPSEPTFGERNNRISPTERELTNSKAEARPSVRARLKEIKAEQNKAKSEAAEIKVPTKKKSKKKGVKENVRT